MKKKKRKKKKRLQPVGPEREVEASRGAQTAEVT